VADVTYPNPRRSILGLAAATLLCCGEASQDEHPPPLSGEPPPIPIACSTLVDDGFELEADTIMVDGEPADCAQDEMVCPLEQSSELLDRAAELAAECQPGEELHAECTQSFWRLTCLRSPTAPGTAGSAGAAGMAGAGGTG
jgi:hypothetical protein